MSCRLFPITVIGNGIEATAIIGNAYFKVMVHGLERNMIECSAALQGRGALDLKLLNSHNGHP
jgi:hypothetical protein